MEEACCGLTSLLLEGRVVVALPAAEPEEVAKVVCSGPTSLLEAGVEAVSEETGPGAVGITSEVAAGEATLLASEVLGTVAVDSTTEVDWTVVVVSPLVYEVGTGATAGPVVDICELSVLVEPPGVVLAEPGGVLDEPGVGKDGNAEAGNVMGVVTVSALSRMDRAFVVRGYEYVEAESSTERALGLELEEGEAEAEAEGSGSHSLAEQSAAVTVDT